MSQASLDIRRLETIGGIAMAYGKLYPEFWIALPHNDEKATIGNGVHVGFIASSKEQVHAFYDAAFYYGCFIIDPDGHKIEATFWDMSLM